MIFRKADAAFIVANAILATIIIFASKCANAETYIHTGAWSHHVDTEYDYNETHKLLAVERNGYLFGYFENSYNDDSALVAAKWDKPLTSNLEASVLVGATYGYRGDCRSPDPAKAKRVCLLAVPAVTYTGTTPQVSGMIMGNAVTLSIRWEL